MSSEEEHAGVFWGAHFAAFGLFRQAKLLCFYDHP